MENQRARIEALVAEMGRELAAGMGFDLVDLEYVREGGRRFLRLFLDKPGGITLDDCGEFSRALSRRLDETDPIPESYTLEVASPGLDRPLKRDRDFEDHRGQAVRVKTFAPLEGQKVFRGQLEGLAEGWVRVRDAGGRVWEIPREMVAQARLDPEL